MSRVDESIAQIEIDSASAGLTQSDYLKNLTTTNKDSIIGAINTLDAERKETQASLEETQSDVATAQADISQTASDLSALSDAIHYPEYLFYGLTTNDVIPDLPSNLVIPFDSNIRTDSVYSVSSGEITVNYDGWVKVTANVGAYNSQTTTNDRYSVKFFIEKYDGLDWAEVLNTRQFTYNRNDEDGENTSSGTYMIEMATGQKIRVVAEINSTSASLGDVTLLANSCSVLIETLSG